MTEDNERGGISDRLKDTVSNVMGADTDTVTGSDAVADVQTDVAGAAGKTVDDPYDGSGGADVNRQFGPAEGGLSDLLPGGPGVGTSEDDTLTDRLNPGSQGHS